MVAQREIWWYEDPENGPRPHLILTRDEAIPFLNRILAVPATTTIRDIPTAVRLGRADGMPKACVLAVDNTTLIRKALLMKRITRVSPEKFSAVCSALGFATRCWAT